MRYVIFRKFLAVLFGLVLTATGLWASGAEEEPAAAMEKEMGDRPHHRRDGDRAAVWRDIDSGHAERPCRL